MAFFKKSASPSSTIDGVPLERLMLVHATSHLPSNDAGGVVGLRSTFDATGGASALGAVTAENFRSMARGLRNTVHTALNGVVGGHDGGDWSDKPIVVVSPFVDAVEANGKPVALNTVDTFWSREPGSPLKLPNAVVVRPGTSSELNGYLFRIRGATAAYNAEPTPSDAAAIGKLTGNVAVAEALARGEPGSVKAAASALRDHVVNQEVIVKHFQAPVKASGKWSWGGSQKVTDDTARAAKAMGVSSAHHLNTPENAVEDALCRGDAQTALSSARRGHPDTAKFAEALVKSPAYERMAKFLVGAEVARKILNSSGATKEVDGIRMDGVVRAGSPDALRLLKTALETIPAGANQAKLAALERRQSARLTDMLEASADAAVGCHVLEALARPLAMMRQRLDNVPITANVGTVRVKVADFDMVRLAPGGDVSVWKGGEELAAGKASGPLVHVSPELPDDELPDDEMEYEVGRSAAFG